MAISSLGEGDEHALDLMKEFMEFSVAPQPLLLSLKEWHPRLLWGQAQLQYPALTKVLCEVYKAPASSAGIERNHKVNKRVHNSRRGRLGDGKVERQVAVAHNTSQLARKLPTKRGSGFEGIIVQAFQATTVSLSVITDDLSAEVDAVEWDDEEEAFAAIETAVAQAGGPLDILDDALFNELS